MITIWYYRMRLTIDRIMVDTVMKMMMSIITVGVLPNFGVPVFWNSMIPVGADIVKHFQGSVCGLMFVYFLYILCIVHLLEIFRFLQIKFFSDLWQSKIGNSKPVSSNNILNPMLISILGRVYNQTISLGPEL